MSPSISIAMRAELADLEMVRRGVNAADGPGSSPARRRADTAMSNPSTMRTSASYTPLGRRAGDTCVARYADDGRGFLVWASRHEVVGARSSRTARAGELASVHRAHIGKRAADDHGSSNSLMNDSPTSLVDQAWKNPVRDWFGAVIGCGEAEGSPNALTVTGKGTRLAHAAQQAHHPCSPPLPPLSLRSITRLRL